MDGPASVVVVVVVVAVVLIVLIVLVAPGVDGGLFRTVTSLSLPLSPSRAFSVWSAALEGTGGDKNSMLGGRGLGCGLSGFEGEDTALRGESCLAPDRVEDGEVGGEEGCSSPLATALGACAGTGAGDDVTVVLASCLSVPLLSVRVCFDVRGVVPSGEWGPVLAGLALLQSSLGTVVALPGAMPDFVSAGTEEGVIASPCLREGLETVFSVTSAL